MESRVEIFENKNAENTELIKVNYEKENPTVSGRDLHEALGIGADYRHWFPRMCEYGFTEGVDFNPAIFDQVRIEGNREVTRTITDHELTIDMAKQICMIQRTEIGRRFREYFLQIEAAWNTPEAVMARALELAHKTIDSLKLRNYQLEETLSIKDQQITEMQPKASYYDIVLQCKDLLPISTIAKDYGWSGKRMNQHLHDKGVQYKQGKIWLLYQKYAEMGYTSTKTSMYMDINGEELMSVNTQWTQKGRLFLYDLLKSDGILPLMEREQESA